MELILTVKMFNKYHFKNVWQGNNKSQHKQSLHYPFLSLFPERISKDYTFALSNPVKR